MPAGRRSLDRARECLVRGLDLAAPVAAEVRLRVRDVLEVIPDVVQALLHRIRRDGRRVRLLSRRPACRCRPGVADVVLCLLLRIRRRHRARRRASRRRHCTRLSYQHLTASAGCPRHPKGDPERQRTGTPSSSPSWAMPLMMSIARAKIPSDQPRCVRPPIDSSAPIRTRTWADDPDQPAVRSTQTRREAAGELNHAEDDQHRAHRVEVGEDVPRVVDDRRCSRCPTRRCHR